MVYVVRSVGALRKAPVTGRFRDNIGCLFGVSVTICLRASWPRGPSAYLPVITAFSLTLHVCC
jgi:hypothetical protein